MVDIIRVGVDDSDLQTRLFEFRFQIYVQEEGMLSSTGSLETQQQECDAYDEHSLHIAAVHNGEVVGCGRVVRDTAGLPILQKTGLHRHPLFHGRHNTEVGRLMVRPDFRGSPVAARLMKEAYEISSELACDNLITDVFKGQTTHRILTRMGFQAVGEEFLDETFALSIPSVVLFLDLSGHTRAKWARDARAAIHERSQALPRQRNAIT